MIILIHCPKHSIQKFPIMCIFTQHLLFDFILTCVNGSDGGDMWVCGMCICMCQGFFFVCPLPHFWRQRFSLNLELKRFDYTEWPVSPMALYRFLPTHLWGWGYVPAHLDSRMDVRNLNSSPRAFEASAWLNEPAPWLLLYDNSHPN